MKKYLIPFLLLLISTTLLSGCTVFFSKESDIPKVEIAKNQWILLPKPSQLSFNVNATQILTATYQDHKGKKTTYTSQVQVEKTPTRLILVAVAGWGGEIFSISYNGKTIETSSLPMPNATFGIKYVLTDFILTYASKNELDSLLKSTDIKLKLKKHQRIFTLLNQPIITIDYKNENPWTGRVVLHNLTMNYKIEISTVSYHQSNKSLGNIK